MVGLREIMTKMRMLFPPQNQMMAMTKHDSLPERSYMKDHSGCLVTEVCSQTQRRARNIQNHY